MQSNHTPGPWSIGNRKETPLNPHALAVWSDLVKVGEVASPVCIVSPIAELDDTDIQNARLIAAAPEMLEALRNLTHPMASDEDLQHALAVIAKAEGRGE